MKKLTFDEQVALLMKDLSGRLPYKVIIDYPHTSYIANIPSTREAAVLTGLDPLNRTYSIGGKYTRTSGLNVVFRGKIRIKPYLRPISSMTEEERKELNNQGYTKIAGELYHYCALSSNNAFYNPERHPYVRMEYVIKLIDWLNANHFDYRGLIPLGLAIDVTTLEDNPYNDEFIY